MTSIQKIVVKQKGKKEYECYLENGQHFGLHEDVLVKMGLYKGQELTDEEITFLEKESELKKVYHHALSYLSYRMRSKQEMEAYLNKKGYPSFAIRSVIQRLQKENFLNDQEFAKAFVRTKVNTTVSGPGKIKRDLMNKGVDELKATRALTHYSHDEQLEQAKKLIQKKMSQSQRVSSKELQNKVKQHLLQKGFTFDMIEEATAALAIHHENEEEWDALLYQAEKAERKYRHLESYQYKAQMKGYLYRKGFSISNIERYFREKSES